MNCSEVKMEKIVNAFGVVRGKPLALKSSLALIIERHSETFFKVNYATHVRATNVTMEAMMVMDGVMEVEIDWRKAALRRT